MIDPTRLLHAIIDRLSQLLPDEPATRKRLNDLRDSDVTELADDALAQDAAALEAAALEAAALEAAVPESGVRATSQPARERAAS